MKTGAATLVAGVMLSSLLACATQDADPLSANHDVVARTVSQDLPVARLSELIGSARAVLPVTHDNVLLVANLWSSYQRLAYAAAHHDTLMDKMDVGITPLINRERVTLLLETLRRSVPMDTTVTEAQYNAGTHNMYSARHILFGYPRNATPAQRDSVEHLAIATYPSIAAATFAALAKRYSSDSASAARGGDLGVLAPSALPAPVAAAFAGLRPGMISKLIPTSAGIDVIERKPWSDAKDQFSAVYRGLAIAATDSQIGARIAAASHIEVKPDRISVVRAAVVDPVAHSGDATVVATFDRGGTMTVGQLLDWLSASPPQQRAEAVRMTPMAADSHVELMARNLALLSVMLREADSAHIDARTAERATMREQWPRIVVETWQKLGVAPEQLAGGERPQAELDQLAAQRVERLFEAYLRGEGGIAPIPTPIVQALDAKYTARTSPAAVDRVVAEATPIRAKADSAHMAVPGSSTPQSGKKPGRASGG